MEHKETQAQTPNFKVAHGVYVGVLMSPAEVATATRNRKGDVYRSLQRWTLCGDVSPALLAVLQATEMRLGTNERITAFTAPSGLNYAVFTHQLAMFQHRFLVPLFDEQVTRCMQQVARGGGLGYSLAAENDQAIVWASVLGARDVVPVAALCGAVAEGREEQSLEEYSRMLREVRDPERIPSLVQGSPVRYASVTAIPPQDVLARVLQRYGAAL